MALPIRGKADQLLAMLLKTSVKILPTLFSAALWPGAMDIHTLLGSSPQQQSLEL